MARRRVFFLTILIALVAGAAALFACGGSFPPQSKVDSVRLFAVRADKPYAKPGETVTLEALATDQRRDKPRAMKIYWIPVVCMNPRDDLYYLCFAPQGDGGAAGVPQTRLVPIGPLAGAAGDGGAEGGGGGAGRGAGAGGLASIPTGVDLSAFLPQGPTISFPIPPDAVQPRNGSSPYGILIVFNVVCAGQVRFGQTDPGAGPQQVPIHCTDEEGTPLPPSDYVIGISRVYAYPDRTNTNPVIEKMTVDGKDVDPSAGIMVDKCQGVKHRTDCKEIKIDTHVSDASWEDNPADVVRGDPLREQIWVDYYTDVGDFDSDARLLFDTRQGRIDDSADKYRAPQDPVDGTVWAVVHDNRGGVSWMVVPIHVR